LKTTGLALAPHKPVTHESSTVVDIRLIGSRVKHSTVNNPWLPFLIEVKITVDRVDIRYLPKYRWKPDFTQHVCFFCKTLLHYTALYLM